MHTPSTSHEHYARLLAEHYSWSVGGAEAAMAATAEWLRDLALPGPPATVVDLGAGFGAAAVPLARRGFAVTAVDESPALLAELAGLDGAHAVERVTADFVGWLGERRDPVDVALCLGDTLPHLSSRDAVAELFAQFARLLTADGIAVLTWRPPVELAGAERFLLVQADDHRTHTCFLETLDPATTAVWDLIHTRSAGGGTDLQVSGYRKLRLSPAWVGETAEAAGLQVAEGPPFRGMTCRLLRRAR